MLKCPKCSHGGKICSSRALTWQDKVLGWFGVRPYRCVDCSTRFYRMRLGPSRSPKSESGGLSRTGVLRVTGSDARAHQSFTFRTENPGAVGPPAPEDAFSRKERGAESGGERNEGRGGGNSA